LFSLILTTIYILWFFTKVYLVSNKISLSYNYIMIINYDGKNNINKGSFFYKKTLLLLLLLFLISIILFLFSTKILIDILIGV